MPAFSEAINLLISGHYADPFSLLGMHHSSKGLEVRALLPDAQAAWVVDANNGRKLVELGRIDERGFFVV
nr:hypothetical protein PJ912_10835 [Pectobacterium colocasium]